MGDWLQRATPWLDIVHMWASEVPKHHLGSLRGCSGVKARPWLLYLGSRWRAGHSQTCQNQRCFSKIHSDCSQTSVMVRKTSRKRSEGIPEACKAHWTAPAKGVGQSGPLRTLKWRPRHSQQQSWSRGRGLGPATACRCRCSACGGHLYSKHGYHTMSRHSRLISRCQALCRHRFSAFWLRSKCSICSYQLNI